MMDLERSETCRGFKQNGHNILRGDRSSTVVKALCYKSQSRWFDPIWCQWNFSLT